MGIAMRADTSLGENAGGLQAPHVIERDGTWHMFYGDWNRICLQRSSDGKTFERYRNALGQPDLFTGPCDNTREPMSCRSAISTTATTRDTAKTASRSRLWYGGDCECPFVAQRGSAFVLFRNARYGQLALNGQYASTNPFAFGVDDDSCRIALMKGTAMPELDGIQMARLTWRKAVGMVDK